MPHLLSAQVTGCGGMTMSLVAAPWPGAMANRGSDMDSPYHEMPTHRLLRRRRVACEALPGGSMTLQKMTREDEYEFYAQPENYDPQGPARRRRPKLTELVPVRFPPETIEEIRLQAAEDDRSVSSWLSRAVEHELHKRVG